MNWEELNHSFKSLCLLSSLFIWNNFSSKDTTWFLRMFTAEGNCENTVNLFAMCQYFWTETGDSSIVMGNIKLHRRENATPHDKSFSASSSLSVCMADTQVTVTRTKLGSLQKAAPIYASALYSRKTARPLTFR